MAEIKKTKASRNYNTAEMTFDLLGKTFTMDVPAEAMESLNDSLKRAILIGASNMAVDSVASLTKESGYTDSQRLARMKETVDSINDGTYKKERAERAGLSTAKVINIVDISVKISTGKSHEVSAEEAEQIKKYSIDLYNQWNEEHEITEE